MSLEIEFIALRTAQSDHEKEDAAVHERVNRISQDLYGNGQPGFIAKTNEEISDIRTLIAKYTGIGIGIASLAGVVSHMLEKLW